jgi:hypothetical protein
VLNVSASQSVMFEDCEVVTVNEEVCETGTVNVKVNLKSQVCCI